MAITEANIKLLKSERMTDEADGGGFMTGTVVADGVENNLFPDISDADRTFGRVQLRKVYAAVTSNDTDTFLGAHAILDEPPADPAASALMVLKAGYTQQRSDVVEALDNSNYRVAVGAVAVVTEGVVLTEDISTTFAVDVPVVTAIGPVGPVPYPQGVVKFNPGDIVGLFSKAHADTIPGIVAIEVAQIASVSYATRTINRPNGTTQTGQFQTVTLTAPVQRSYANNSDTSGLGDYIVKLEQDVGSAGALTFYGQSVTTGALAINDTSIPVESSFAQYIPIGDSGTYPTVDPEVLGVDPEPFQSTFGRVKIFRRNEAIVVHHTATTAPSVVANGTDIDVGRPKITKFRVIGNDGNEITSGFTVNKLTGHVVFTDVTGYSQPVKIEHRIEDMLLVAEASENTITVARGVTHAFPPGARVSSVVMLGDMQALAHDGFAQATWTGEWSDTLIGSAPLADFFEALHPITVNNAGAITERWAVIFTNATNFRVIGEQVGEVIPSSAGNTGANCSPLNPATGQPFFTIPATGWGSGWAAGNVFRFNTTGANSPLWLIRSIAPSDPFVGQDKFTVALRGNVNA